MLKTILVVATIVLSAALLVCGIPLLKSARIYRLSKKKFEASDKIKKTLPLSTLRLLLLDDVIDVKILLSKDYIHPIAIKIVYQNNYAIFPKSRHDFSKFIELAWEHIIASKARKIEVEQDIVFISKVRDDVGKIVKNNEAKIAEAKEKLLKLQGNIIEELEPEYDSTEDGEPRIARVRRRHPRFKVGDKVQVREDIEHKTKCTSSMIKYAGMEATITETECVVPFEYKIDIDNGTHTWKYTMFETEYVRELEDKTAILLDWHDGIVEEMKRSEYLKVGDWIRVRKDLKPYVWYSDESSIMCNDIMLRCAGNVARVIKVDSCTPDLCYISLDNGAFRWNKELFEIKIIEDVTSRR